jgi:antitoxin VapB
MDAKAKVFVTGRSQAVRLPAAFRFSTKEVFVRRDAASGDVILSTKPENKSWDEVFATLDAAGIPPDFALDRDMRLPVERDDL